MTELKCVIGTNSWGSKAYEKAVRGSYVEDSVIEEAVETALNNGLDVFDTADDYGFGYAQKLIGRFRETREFRISAKYTPTGRYKPGQVHKVFEKQLHDMKTDYVDYYWLHLPNDIEENLAEIVEMYHEGRIRNIGISNFSLEEAKRAKEYLEKHGVSLYGVQNHFSLLERAEEQNGMLAWCHENGIAFWGWAVLEEGILTGNTKSTFARLFRRKQMKLQNLFRVMREIGETHHLEMAQVAVVYCISKGVIPVCGCRKPYQVRQLAEDAEAALDEAEVRKLEEAADETGVKILKSDIFRGFVKKEKQNMSGRRPDYKNWMPKWMIGTSLTLTAGMAASAVFLSAKGKKAALPAFGTALSGGVSAWLLYCYDQYSYNGKRQLSKQIIEGTASYTSLPEGGIGLDIGCGSGALTIACAKRNPEARMIGIDRWGREYIDFSRKLCEENAEAEGVENVSFQPGNAIHLDFPDETFDAVTSNYVYHNIPVKKPEDRQEFIRETLRVLKKGGTFAIHDIFSAGKYGNMQEFMEKLKAEGYEDVKLIHTDEGMFMSRKEAAILGCAGSALLAGRK